MYHWARAPSEDSDQPARQWNPHCKIGVDNIIPYRGFPTKLKWLTFTALWGRQQIDDIFLLCFLCLFFFFFFFLFFVFLEIGFDTSCRLSPREGGNLHEVSTSIFGGNKKNISNCRQLPSKHTASLQHRCSDVATTLLLRCVFAGWIFTQYSKR